MAGETQVSLSKDSLRCGGHNHPEYKSNIKRNADVLQKDGCAKEGKGNAVCRCGDGRNSLSLHASMTGCGRQGITRHGHMASAITTDVVPPPFCNSQSTKMVRYGVAGVPQVPIPYDETLAIPHHMHRTSGGCTMGDQSMREIGNECNRYFCFV